MDMKNILSIIEKFDTDETIALTQKMIQIPSIDPPGNEAAMSEFVKDYLECAGIEVEAIAVGDLVKAEKILLPEFQAVERLRR